MKPLSPFMYIMRNKGRCIVIVMILMMVTACFIASAFIENPTAVVEQTLKGPTDYVIVKANSGSGDILDKYREFGQNVDRYLTEEFDTAFEVGIMTFDYKCIMGFDNSAAVPVFVKPEDFELFRDRTGLPSDMHIEEGEAILSRLLADNWGIKEGDIIPDDFDRASFARGLKIKEIRDLKGMQIYAVSAGVADRNFGIMVLRSSVRGTDDIKTDKAADDFAARVKSDYDMLGTITNDQMLKSFNDSLGFMSLILWAITILAGTVLAITINALFAAAFDKRRYEFSIYRAIGIGSGKLLGKILSEILILDAAALLIGSVICALIMVTVNYVYRPQGMYFPEIPVSGIFATMVCNAIVVIPVMILNQRRVKRSDVTAY